VTGRIGFCLAGALLIGGAARAWSLAHWTPATRQPTPDSMLALASMSESSSSDLLQTPTAKALGVRRVTALVFDPQAVVLLCPGDDAAPGKARFDDDADGIVDNASELGAMYSDDRCLAPLDPGYDEALETPSCKVISQGAYVASELVPGQHAHSDDHTAHDHTSPDHPPRWLISGRLNGRDWEREMGR
tara:strand:- start:1959 stop:2525 length:567 start_codon:yes stop_codon:yes gene_type:complete